MRNRYCGGRTTLKEIQSRSLLLIGMIQLKLIGNMDNSMKIGSIKHTKNLPRSRLLTQELVTLTEK